MHAVDQLELGGQMWREKRVFIWLRVRPRSRIQASKESTLRAQGLLQGTAGLTRATKKNLMKLRALSEPRSFALLVVGNWQLLHFVTHFTSIAITILFPRAQE